MKRLTVDPGTTYYRWTVLSVAEAPAHLKRKAAYLLCRCECGTEKVIDGAALVRGDTKSCGCLRFDTRATLKHGLYGTPLYNLYHQMMQRCTNPSSENYPGWGGRGIEVCAEWATDVEAFVQWATTNGWRPGLTLERKDNNGHYTPANCVFATNKTQANNRRNNIRIEFRGETLTLAQIAERCGVVYVSLHYLYRKKGLNIDDAIRLARRNG